PRAGRQPDGEGLRPVLAGMALRIAVPEVLDEVLAMAARPVARPIRRAERPEVLAPARALVEPVGVVERVPRLVAEDAHAARDVAAFRVTEHAALERDEARMRRVERDREAGAAVRRE